MRPRGVPLILLIVWKESVLVQFDCHSEQAFFAVRNLGEPRDGSRSLRSNNRAFGSLPIENARPTKNVPKKASGKRKGASQKARAKFHLYI
jgi:hypothetical protein